MFREFENVYRIFTAYLKVVLLIPGASFFFSFELFSKKGNVKFALKSLNYYMFIKTCNSYVKYQWKEVCNP